MKKLIIITNSRFTNQLAEHAGTAAMKYTSVVSVKAKSKNCIMINSRNMRLFAPSNRESASRKNPLRSDLLAVVNDHLIKYPTPINLNYFWNFGSLAGMCLLIQIISGVFLAMHYTPNVDLAFASIEHIMRDVPYGWLLRYTHSNGASIFFIVIYIHISRGLFYGSYLYPRQYVWYSGLIIFILMMATAFMGYVLPWGQMSFWGATVITNLFSAIPFVGSDVAEFLWGGFSVGNPTLNRFFSLHFLLPFVIVGMVGVHLVLLHQVGSSNPQSIEIGNEKVPFYPYFFVKDLLGFVYLLLAFCIIISFYPNTLSHPDNYIPANPLVTPAHIVPEWYFLPFYAILRSIPNKLGGVLCMVASIGVLFLLPSILRAPKNHKRYQAYDGDLHYDWISLGEVDPLNCSRYLASEFVFWLFIYNTFFLGWIGTCPVEYPFLGMGQVCTFLHFFYLFCFRVMVYFYKPVVDPNFLSDFFSRTIDEELYDRLEKDWSSGPKYRYSGYSGKDIDI